MRLRLLSLEPDSTLRIEGTNLELRKPIWADYARWARIREKSRFFLEKWEPKWPHDDLTKTGFRRRLQSINRQWQDGKGKSFFLFDAKSDELLGGASLSRISKGTAGSATLGYWMGVQHSDKGHMTLAATRIIEHAFNDLDLNRVEAAALPSNGRSIHLLKKLGFQREGYARQYLEINGVAEDHILFAYLRCKSKGTGKQRLSVV